MIIQGMHWIVYYSFKTNRLKKSKTKSKRIVEMKKYVTDGEQVFHYYYWNKNGQIVSTINKKVINGYKNNFGLLIVILKTDQGKRVGRSFDKLNKLHQIKKYLPKNYDQYIDVFGYENTYCFDPNDPTKVFSKKNLAFKKILSNKDGYLFIRAGKGTLYLHTMVYQSMNNIEVDKDMYQIHHISGDNKQNNIENLKLLTKKEHRHMHKSKKVKNETN